MGMGILLEPPTEYPYLKLKMGMGIGLLETASDLFLLLPSSDLVHRTAAALLLPSPPPRPAPPTIALRLTPPHPLLLRTRCPHPPTVAPRCRTSPLHHRGPGDGRRVESI